VTPNEEAEARRETDERQERIGAIAEQLRETESLDSIVILATYTRNGITQSSYSSLGNHYANAGIARRFVLGLEEEWRKES
jgi:hypothetical protein